MTTETAEMSTQEHPITASIRLRAMRRALWMRTLWNYESADAHPAAIQHEEVDRILLDPTITAEAEAHFYATNENALLLAKQLAYVETSLKQESRWQLLVNRFGLQEPEWHLLALAVAVSLEPRLGRVLAYLHDQPEMTYATPWLAAALHGPGACPADINHRSALIRWELIHCVSEVHVSPGLLTAWDADPAIAAWLVNGGDSDLPPQTYLVHPDGFSQPVIYPEILSSMLAFSDEMEWANMSDIQIELAAPVGSGRKTLAAQYAAARKQELLIVRQPGFDRDLPQTVISSRVLSAARSAYLRKAILYWSCDESEQDTAIQFLRSTGMLFIVGRVGASSEPTQDSVAFRSFELPTLSLDYRRKLWNSLTSDDAPPQIHEWLLTPAEIIAIKRVSGSGQDAIVQACRRPMKSADLLVRLTLPFSKKDLVLPDSVMSSLDDMTHQVRQRWIVYEEWGFERLCPNGRGIIALFAGPSGTGKTMAAQVLARSLGIDLYRLDPANVVNKYVGETEKRLKTIFDEFDRVNSLLLIDECEGMLGQRFSSKDAHDRYANLEIDYLLQRIERFQGLAIFATNRKGDLDPAFLRRFRIVIDFLPPGPVERRQLWMAAFNANEQSGKHILDGIDWESLSERIALTGAEINLAALNAAFLARAAGEKIGMKHVLKAVQRELAKRGQTLRGFE